MSDMIAMKIIFMFGIIQQVIFIVKTKHEEYLHHYMKMTCKEELRHDIWREDQRPAGSKRDVPA